MKKIALFGGSFNPPHDDHFEAARYIRESLKVDEVWFLFSHNRFKDISQYASTAHRMEMGRIMLKHHHDPGFVLSDIQDRMGTHITYEVLQELQKQNPDDRFIWVMGADNLLSFNTWAHYEDILQNFPVAVVPREPYTEKALQSHAALTFAHLKIEKVDDLSNAPNGWAMLEHGLSDMSSSSLLAKVRAGDNDFTPGFREVLAYMRQHHLYGLDNTPPPQPQNTPNSP